MKAERLFRVLGLIDPALVEEAMEARGRRTIPWKRWGALAACLAVALGIGWSVKRVGLGGGASGASGSGASNSVCVTGADEAGAPEDAGSGGGGVEDGITFMSYAGPVFPLTMMEGAEGLTAERTVTWDFAPGAYQDGASRQWGAEVTDSYILVNPSSGDIAAVALYPFAGTFMDLAELRPAVSVDGGEAEAVLYAGAYSGGFQSTFGGENPDTMNLDTLDGWKEYKALLEDGAYLAQALGEYPALDLPVTVYEFSDFQAPLEEYRAATQAVSFAVDESAARIFTYGFNGMDQEGGLRRYSYFVPDGVRNEPDLKLLIVLGEDIGAYTLQGYQDGGCDPGEEIEGVSCTVTRRETTLDAVLDRLCRYYRDRAESRGNGFGEAPFETYRGAVAELLAQYGLLSGNPMDRYADGRLDDILMETLGQDRVLYLAFPVTVRTGESVRVDCRFWKAPSFDYSCSGSENAGLQGFDLVTRLGSALEFTAQRAALENVGGITLAEQNFGFDLESGATAVELDPHEEHYYMTIRAEE